MPQCMNIEQYNVLRYVIVLKCNHVSSTSRFLVQFRVKTRTVEKIEENNVRTNKNTKAAIEVRVSFQILARYSEMEVGRGADQ